MTRYRRTENLLQAIAETYNAEALNDIKIISKNGTLAMSPLILAATSKWLKKVLLDNSNEDVVIVVPDLRTDDLQTFFHLLLSKSSSLKTIRKNKNAVRNVLSLLRMDIDLSEPQFSSSSSDSDSTARYLSDVDIGALSNDTIDDNFSDQDARLVCLVCYKIFSSGDHRSFKTHIQSHTQRALKRVRLRPPPTPVTCPKCKRKFSHDMELSSHECVWIKEQLKCKECSKSFVDFRGMQSHLKSHQEKISECPKCKSTFSSELLLQKHLKNEICDTQCKECGKIFVDRARLKVHARLHEEGDRGRPFACTACDKKFSQKRTLDEHSLTHNPSRKFNCGHCSKTFVQKNHLLYHLTAKHNEGGSHKCSICDKTFPFVSQLNAHSKRSHKKRQ